MKKITAILIVAFLVVMTVPQAVRFKAQNEYGIESFVRHDWKFTELDLDVTTDIEEEPFVYFHYFEDIVDAFAGTKMVFLIGKVDNTAKVAYVVPALMTTRTLEVTPEMVQLFFSDAIGENLTDEEAEHLAFTIPKGSTLTFVTPGFDSSPPLSVASIIRSFEKAVLSYAIPTIPGTAMPYHFAWDSSMPPLPLMPMVDPTDLDDMGTSWQAMDSQVEGISFSYSNRVFEAGGENTTEDVTISVDFRSEYSELGILTALDLDLSVSGTVDLDGGENGSLSISLSMSMDHVGAKEIDVGLVDDEKIGFKITEFNVTEDFIEFLQAMNVSITMENFTEFSDVLKTLGFEYQYQEPNTYYDTGLDLLFNLKIYNLSDETLLEDAGDVSFNGFYLASPYLIPEWDVLTGEFQTGAHLVTKILPNLWWFALHREDPNFVFEPTAGDYKVLKYGTEWMSMDMSLNLHMAYPETNENWTMFDATFNLETWMTYSYDGYLTEYAITGSFTLKFDNDSDSSLDDEPTYSGTITFVINKVENDSTGEPDYTAPLDSPDPTASGWEDVTPATAAGGGGFLPEIPGGTTTIIVGAGVVAVIAILFFAFRRRP